MLPSTHKESGTKLICQFVPKTVLNLGTVGLFTHTKIWFGCELHLIFLFLNLHVSICFWLLIICI